jgi:hypothetical protein
LYACITAKMGEALAEADTGDCYYLFIAMPSMTWYWFGEVEIALESE